MDKYQEMRVFSAVNEFGSFVAAAEALGISKAAASKYISDLEQRLSVRLLHRTTRKLSLTEGGELFLARCREILAAVEESEAEVSTNSASATGLLRVSAPLSFGVRHLAMLWPEFMSMHPAVKVDVNLSDRVADLIEDGFDLAVRIASMPASTLVSRKLASTRLILCASPDYLRRRGAPRHPDDLAEHDVIGYRLSATGDYWRFTGPDGPMSVKLKPRLWTNNGDTSVACAVGGAGIDLQPSFLIADELDNGRLIQLMPEYRSVELGIYAVYPTRKFVPPKVRALIDFLATRLANNRW